MYETIGEKYQRWNHECLTNGWNKFEARSVGLESEIRDKRGFGLGHWSLPVDKGQRYRPICKIARVEVRDTI